MLWLRTKGSLNLSDHWRQATASHIGLDWLHYAMVNGCFGCCAVTAADSSVVWRG